MLNAIHGMTESLYKRSVKRPKTTFVLALILSVTVSGMFMVLTDRITPREMGLISTAINIIGAIYFSLIASGRDETHPLTTFLFVGLAMGTLLTSSSSFYSGNWLTRLEGIGYIIFALLGLALWYWTAILDLGEIPPVLSSIIPQDILDYHR